MENLGKGKYWENHFQVRYDIGNFSIKIFTYTDWF